jgi:hypothetical protein
MTDQEFADFLRSLPREIPPEKVEEIEREHDAERGVFQPLPGHHHYGESHH